MAQQNYTLYLQDPNGGQPQLIKVIGKPGLNLGSNVVSVSSSSASVSSGAPQLLQQPTTKTILQQPPTKTILRAVTTSDQAGSSGLSSGPVFQTGKLANGQLVTLRAASARSLVLQPGSIFKATSQQSTPSVRPVVIRATTSTQSLQQPVTAVTSSTGIKLASTVKPVVHAGIQPPIKQLSQPQVIHLSQEQQQTSNKLENQPLLLQSRLQVVQQQQPIKVSTVSSVGRVAQQQSQTSPPKTVMTAPILDHTAGRKRHDFDFDYNVDNKRRKTEKGGKGLRHFSMKVCEKVKAKGRTSYNEVADELVAEFCDPMRCAGTGEANDDQKNIRRRVYDALNVLMAMDIISKEKKEIRWLGLPTNTAQECHRLKQERNRRAKRISLKTQQLRDLILQQIAFRRLVARNRAREAERGPPSPNTSIPLPFVVVATANSTTIDCSIANDKAEYLFNFDGPFELHDDIEVLKRMNLAMGLERGEATPESIVEAKSLLPLALESYVDDMAQAATEPCILSRDQLVQELGGLGIAGGEFGCLAGGGGAMVVMETTDKLGGALGGVQRLTTDGGVLEGHVGPSLLLGNSNSSTMGPSPSSSVTGDDFAEESDGDIG